MSGENRRPTLGPARRAARDEAAEYKQEMLGQESQKIAASTVNAAWLQGAGALLFAVGIGNFIVACKKKP